MVVDIFAEAHTLRKEDVCMTFQSPSVRGTPAYRAILWCKKEPVLSDIMEMSGNLRSMNDAIQHVGSLIKNTLLENGVVSELGSVGTASSETNSEMTGS